MDFLRAGFYYEAVPADLTDKIRTVSEGTRVVRWHILADLSVPHRHTSPSGNEMVPRPRVPWRVLAPAWTHTLS